jgi:simple sugar transport system permease protein
MDLMEFSELLLSGFRFSAPLILAAMAGLYSERSGIVQIALEGFMLFGAFVAGTAAFYTSDGPAGMMAAVLFGALSGIFYGFLVIKLRADQIVAGTVINMLAWGTIPVVCKHLFDSTAGTPSLELSQRLPSWFPIVIAFAVVLITARIFKHTVFGLRLSVAGEKPEALEAVGVNPRSLRWAAVVIAGALAGLAGSLLSICLSAGYSRNMTAGRGFMALAALILGKWKPWPAFFAYILFGFCEVVQLKAQGAEIPFFGVIPGQLIQVVPYIVTLALIAGLVGESRAPAKLGQSS